MRLSTCQSSTGYRYGFNGMEKDDEVSGEGNSYTAPFWQYDSRVARRWNIDPVVKHNESPYATFANNPIWFVDPSGADSSKVSGSNTWSWDTEKGDTYNSISSRTGVSVENLQKWNPSYESTKIPTGANLNISDPSLPQQKGPATATIGDGIISVLSYESTRGILSVGLIFEPNSENKDGKYMWFQVGETNDPKQFDNNGNALELVWERSLSSMTFFDDKHAGYNKYHKAAMLNDTEYNKIPRNYRSQFRAFPVKEYFPTGMHIPRGNTLGFLDTPNRPCIDAGEIIWRATLVLRKKVDGNWVDVQTLTYGFNQLEDKNTPKPLILQNSSNK